ncbi:hypothetical protein Pcinc_009930 [Petrolisthes cinctipes]|uniref:Argonaute 2 n=1 Tax=Petrolisthes cinctipes TaxID=88211 RepID=A0AAE1G3R4_PETCI|nr:hypothetical protein Pcinc_025891 [Petrolisthes cinctipes]KAK3885868.1 hypothetical protein Pcinc_009930 [Petrolisthes cinctipes]
MFWKKLTEKPGPPSREKGDHGTIGKRIPLKVNFFPVEMKNPYKTLIHFDVNFKELYNGKPQDVQLSKNKQQLIFENMRQSYPRVFENAFIAFDGERNAYSVESVSPVFEKDTPKVLEVSVADGRSRTKKFLVSMKMVNMENLHTLLKALQDTSSHRKLPLNIMHMLEVLLHYSPTLSFEKIGRNSFFGLNGELSPSMDIGGGKEIMVGFFESLRPVGWKKNNIFLNIDVAHAAYYKDQSVLNFMVEVLGCCEEDFQRGLTPQKQNRLKKELKNMKIQVTHTDVPRVYKVQDVSSQGAYRQYFPFVTDDGDTVGNYSVQSYFRDRYDKLLKYPKLNCLKVGPVKKNIFLPIEFCKIAKGQKVTKKLNDRETANFIRRTARKPSERLGIINNMIMKQRFGNDPILRALEFTVSDQPVNLDGRVLPAPKLLMGNEEFKPELGVWNCANNTFYHPAELSEWAIVNYDGHYVQEDRLWRFFELLQNLGRERGMHIRPPVFVQNMKYPNPEKDFEEIKWQHANIQLIFVVLPQQGDWYSRVKKVGDLDERIITQCVKGVNVNKCAQSIVGNILLKINAKLGGINNVLGISSQPIFFKKPVMLMGADVNHPSAQDKTSPSLAAVVASIDCYAAKYATEVRYQHHRTEMIQDLKGMTKNLLKAFYISTKRKPERIIIYRDGVSESQFLEALSFELQAMRQACMELEDGYEPGMTFLVVQKRHHTRFFCHEHDGVGKTRNIPPGTIVDTQVTHPTEKDFYLCSHQGIQGTSRPTHYHLLWDDNDLTMDQLQMMTYAMCHLYSRCSRSVSIPTPTYYAHLAAFRAKVHLKELWNRGNSSTAGEQDPALIQRGITSKMYYV